MTEHDQLWTHDCTGLQLTVISVKTKRDWVYGVTNNTVNWQRVHELVYLRWMKGRSKTEIHYLCLERCRDYYLSRILHNNQTMYLKVNIQSITKSENILITNFVNTKWHSQLFKAQCTIIEYEILKGKNMLKAKLSMLKSS